MPQLEINTTWVVKLSTDELRIVLKCLAQHVLNETEKSAAHDIQSKLHESRWGITKTTMAQADKALAPTQYDAGESGK
jgi:hypothetical protein